MGWRIRSILTSPVMKVVTAAVAEHQFFNQIMDLIVPAVLLYYQAWLLAVSDPYKGEEVHHEVLPCAAEVTAAPSRRDT